VIAFVGPTGVGKTTTLAKLATRAKLIDCKNVAIISADTFRIAAVEQLKTFANIAEIPFKVVYSSEDIKNAISEFSAMDHIFIDTTGRSQKDAESLKDIKNMLSSVEPGEVHLVLSVTTKYKDILDILEKFKGLFINRLIFTKLDETTTLGAIFNVVEKIRKPISYVTYGQNVPDDFEPADARKLAKMILRRSQHYK
jgi:flagellar biosynthesis protein FlhF